MEFSNEIIKLLDDLGKRLGVAIDWSNENIMPYLNGLVDRFIKWEIARSIFNISISIVLIVIGIYGIKCCFKRKNKWCLIGELDESITWLWAGTIIVLMIGFSMFSFECYDLIKVIYLPEMAIYDYVQSLMNTQ